jgi:hypothetical protein
MNNDNNKAFMRIYVVKAIAGPAVVAACSMLVSFSAYSSTLKSEAINSSETSAYSHL